MTDQSDVRRHDDDGVDCHESSEHSLSRHTIDVSSGMLPSWYKPNNIIRRTWLLSLCLSIVLVTVAVGTQYQGA
eukprot:CCRYP_020112-RA/>CCRYP_020112-RA protein AED:0.43 eAED:0.43 QI:186/1/1/1/0/0/2/0/73